MKADRTYLRTREAWFRKNPIDDAHVKLFKKLLPKILTELKAQASTWECPRCSKVVRSIDRHRDSSGHLSKHCGCSVDKTIGMTPEQLASHKRLVIISLKRKYRLQRGVKPLDQRRAQRIEREAAKLAIKKANDWARELHDSHVKVFKSDEARYGRWKYANVPSYAMYHRLKSWMHKHLGDRLPSRKWSQYLGYSTSELRSHLERQFIKGMSWDNKGKWHIDHIRPVASFDIHSIESVEFRDCFGLHNLRPVWAKENMRKGAKREFLV